MPTIHKVMAYITRGDELLIFREPDFPEAGLQVPGGTLEAGESPEAGALREAIEETGLSDLRVVRFLGEQIRDMVEAGKGEVHHRHFFHMTTSDPRPSWRWYETAPFLGGKPIALDLFFVPITNVPSLITEHDHFVPALGLTSRP